MANFNLLVARVISSSVLHDIPQDYVHLFQSNGVLKRARIPEWAKRAIIFRDHGYCVKCHKDVSIQRRNNTEAQIDHIIPLADGGGSMTSAICNYYANTAILKKEISIIIPTIHP